MIRSAWQAARALRAWFRVTGAGDPPDEADLLFLGLAWRHPVQPLFLLSCGARRPPLPLSGSLTLFDRQADPGGLHVQKNRLQVRVGGDGLDELGRGGGSANVIRQDQAAGPDQG